MKVVGVLVLAAFLGVAAGCSGGEEIEEPTAAAPTDSPVAANSPSNPVVMGDGIVVPMEPQVMPGFPSITVTCRADGYVATLDGEVVSVGDQGWGRSKPQIGEAVYDRDGSRYVYPIFVWDPAYRAADGKLISGWRQCVITPGSDVECEDDGVVWALDGFVAEVVKQPSGKEAEAGEQLYGPDGLPYYNSTYTQTPVTRGDDGRLVFGWPKCEAKELPPR